MVRDMDNSEIIKTFEDYKGLNDDERNYFLFQSLHKMSGSVQTLIENFNLDNLDKRYDAKFAVKSLEIAFAGLEAKFAGKWTEKFIIAICSVTGLTVLAALLSLILIHH